MNDLTGIFVDLGYGFNALELNPATANQDLEKTKRSKLIELLKPQLNEKTIANFTRNSKVSNWNYSFEKIINNSNAFLEAFEVSTDNFIIFHELLLNNKKFRDSFIQGNIDLKLINDTHIQSIKDISDDFLSTYSHLTKLLGSNVQNIIYKTFYRSFFDAIASKGYCTLMDIAKTPSGIKAIEESLKNIDTKVWFCLRANHKLFYTMLRKSKILQNHTDELGNSLMHYFTALREFNSKQLALKLININKDMFLKENNLGFSPFQLMKNNGLSEEKSTAVLQKAVKSDLQGSIKLAKKQNKKLKL